jgi:hypothetical protein
VNSVVNWLQGMLCTYLENSNKIDDDAPIFTVQLILVQLQGLVGCDGVNRLTILESEGHHVVCRIPSCDNVSGYDIGFESTRKAMLAPCMEGECR